MIFKTTALGLFALAASGAMTSVVAQNSVKTTAPTAAALSARISFDIPAQPLAQALRQFADQTGLQLAFETALATGRMSPEIKGTLSQEDALKKLLEGTGLRYDVLDGRTIVVSPSAKTSAAVPAAGTLRLAQQDYSAAAPASEPASANGLEGNDRVASTESEGSGKTILGEVVVTAQKRAERAQDVPISIGVLSGNTIERSGSRSVADILNQVAGVSMIEREPGYTQIALRGVVPDQSLGTSTTGYYLDEVPFSFITRSQLPDASAFDLARVEVLRGPQGTLYGANALSGVVRVLTNDANLDAFEAKGRARTSQTDEGGDNYAGDLAVNVPLIPGELAIRAVASYSDLSGYIDTAGGQRRFNDTEAKSYRIKANYEPSDRLSVKLGLTRSEVLNGGPSYAFDDLTTPFSDNQADERLYDTYNVIAEYRWSSVSLLSSTAYLDYDSDTQTEIEAFPGFFLNFLNGFDLRSFSQEFRLASRLSGPWQWTAGAIYKDTTEKLTQRAPAFFPSPLIEDQRSDSYAVFAETSRAFDDARFELTGGLRYYDEHAVSTEISSFSGTPTTPRRPADFDRVTGRVVLAYKPRANRTFYGSVATGFRAGLNQSSAVAGTNPDFGPVNPDTLVNYEVGAKGSLADGTVVVDLAVYFTEWDDIQQSLITAFGFVAGLNTGSASGPGFDGSIAYRPLQALTLQANVGWSGLELDEDVPFGTPPVVLFKGGERVNLSPEWTGSVGGSYRFAMPVGGVHAVLSSNFTYRSSVTLRYLAGGTLTPSESEATRTLKASLGLEGDRWSLDLFGDNLLDDRDGIMPPDLTFAGTSIRQRPRTIGLQATFNY